MADNVEEIQKSIKKYFIIGGLLIALSAATVGLSYVELPTHGQNILLGMILATFKAALVALIFMHLNHERSIIYKILAFTVVFAVVLFALFIFSHEDPLTFSGFYTPADQL
ncbi:cytochrome C oxidase subunit IV family protein [Prosthecobacter vanneervenii]|uniref:Caa(3)-type oxidase subunit IV n=1 Tax=Prosthecobacter vanneervenii TaxID=48466 RepID=A0A7W7YEA5_9BACT|nr:cytochrome C oxidase subunit IV family protein [Prosthecobacter vanneervenii]MBB5034544.1 caa(3)-type oxidase subunit IV [Prosthecobacter vanneervenii]